MYFQQNYSRVGHKSRYCMRDDSIMILTVKPQKQIHLCKKCSPNEFCAVFCSLLKPCNGFVPKLLFKIMLVTKSGSLMIQMRMLHGWLKYKGLDEISELRPQMRF